jgi:hypothetical protein
VVKDGDVVVKDIQGEIRRAPRRGEERVSCGMGEG